MFELKALSKSAIPAALEKAMRYRLLNEPGEAESICLDILRVDPDNQQAFVVLLLATTDRFGKGYSVGVMRSQEILPKLRNPYDRAYYSGIISERRAKSYLAQGLPGAGSDAYELLREAMECYAQAESLRPPDNDDALLRWNACARIINENHLQPRQNERMPMDLE